MRNLINNAGMNHLFKRTIVFFLFCGVFLCCSCASTPKFNSVRDVDRFIAQERVKPYYTKQGMVVAFMRPERRNSHIATTIVPVIGNAGPMYMLGFLNIARYGVTYRKLKNEPKLDVVSEAKKRAGKPPESSSCEFEGMNVSAEGMLTDEYRGGEGYIKIAKVITARVNYKGKENASPPCNTETWKIYEDYVRTVFKHAEEIIVEDEAARFKDGYPEKEKL